MIGVWKFKDSGFRVEVVTAIVTTITRKKMSATLRCPYSLCYSILNFKA